MKKINIIYIIITITLVVILGVLIKSNCTLKTENEQLSNIKNESRIIKDSLEMIKNSYLLVDNVRPMVVNGINESTGEKTKRIFLVIRDCHVRDLSLITGNLDTSKSTVSDTTNDITLHEEKHFNHFSIVTDNLNSEIEGVVELYFPKKGYIRYPFSEKHYKWWK